MFPPALACPFLQFVSCPEGPHSIPLLYSSSHSPLLVPPALPLSLSLSVSASSPSLSPSPSLHALQRPIKCAPAVQAMGAVYHGTSSGSPRSTAQHAHNLCTSVLHVILNIIDRLNKSTTHRAVKQPSSTYHILDNYVAKTRKWSKRKIQNTAKTQFKFKCVDRLVY